MNKKHSKYLIPGIIVIGMVLRLPFTSIPPIINNIAEAQHVPVGELGILTTIPLIAFALFSSAVPKTAEKLGLERAFSVMILLMILGSAMRVVNTPLLYVGTLLLGIGIAHMNVLLPSVIRTYFPTKIGPMTSMFTFSMMLATAAGAGLSAPIAAKFGWQTVIIILSCALLMAWIIWLPNDWFSVKQKSFSEKTHVPSKEKSNGIWRNKYAWLLLFFSGMQSAMFYILMAWGPTMAVQTGLSPEIAGAFSGLNSLIGLPAALIVPTIISNMTKRMRQMFISGISALGLFGYVLLLHQVGSFWYWLVVNLLIGISTSVLFPYLMTTFSLKTDSPMQTAELSGMSQSGGYLLAALGPALFGYAYGWFHSWQPQLIVALVMFALMIVSIVIVERQDNIF